MLYDSDKIKNLMRQARISGNELARRAGISGPSMHDILRGRTKEAKFSTIASIAVALGVSIQQVSKPKAAKGKRDLTTEASSTFSQLSEPNQTAMLAAMQQLLALQKK